MDQAEATHARIEDKMTRDLIAKDPLAKDLLAKAAEARTKAYVPYSGFAVGAALLTGSGRVYTGCNVENASFGATICAERTAMVKAISEGERDFRAIAVIGDSAGPCRPCGVCRQVLVEFAPEARVYMANLKGDLSIMTSRELLPAAFTEVDVRRGAPGAEGKTR